MMKERKRNRLKGYDYSSDNLYFVTSCVQDRVCCFGKIEIAESVWTGRNLSQRMILNELGAIAEKQWYWLSEQYPYVILHAFIVMPNHIHGIIEINRNIVGTGRDLSLQQPPDPSQQPKIKSLSELMGAYKTTVSKQIHLLECGDGSRCRDGSRPVLTSRPIPSIFDRNGLPDFIK